MVGAASAYSSPKSCLFRRSPCWRSDCKSSLGL